MIYIATVISVYSCINADPNFGSSWFHSRQLPYDIPSIIIASAVETLKQELWSAYPLYLRAVLCYVQRCVLREPELSHNQHIFFSTDHQHLLLKPSDADADADHIVGPSLQEGDGGALFCVRDFVTAYIEVNRAMYSPHVSHDVRWKILFGVDQIVT
jgi:hypothetical protein